MKKFILILMIITLSLFITSCNKKEAIKVINDDYIKKNNGILFNDYALAIDQEQSSKDVYAIYKKTSSNRYQKIFNIIEYNKNDKILATDKYIYIFYEKGDFIGYNLNSSVDNIKIIEPEFDNIDGLIYYPIDIYGFKDNYIYISYYKDDSKRKILYAKVKDNLKKYENINKSDIPNDIKNYINN